MESEVKEDAMRLHVDDCDHLLRAPVQLLLGIKNATCKHSCEGRRKEIEKEKV